MTVVQGFDWLHGGVEALPILPFQQLRYVQHKKWTSLSFIREQVEACRRDQRVLQIDIETGFTDIGYTPSDTPEWYAEYKRISMAMGRYCEAFGIEVDVYIGPSNGSRERLEIIAPFQTRHTVCEHYFAKPHISFDAWMEREAGWLELELEILGADKVMVGMTIHHFSDWPNYIPTETFVKALNQFVALGAKHFCLYAFLQGKPYVAKAFDPEAGWLKAMYNVLGHRDAGEGLILPADPTEPPDPAGGGGPVVISG